MPILCGIKLKKIIYCNESVFFGRVLDVQIYSTYCLHWLLLIYFVNAVLVTNKNCNCKNTLAFLGLGDNVLFHSRLCRLVSGSYSKVHDSSPVTTLFSKLGSVSSCSQMSWHTCTRRFFCPSFCNLGTIFAQIFLIHRSSVMILHTLSLFRPSHLLSF